MVTSTQEQFISLRKAAKISPYSQEYLSLRARQGKLQAIKRGRNWVTTKVWLKDYVAKANDHKSSIEEKRESEKAALIPWPDPPLNLPLHAPDADEWEDGTAAEVAARTMFWRKFPLALAVATLVVYLGVSVVQGKDEIMSVADDVSPVVLLTSAHILSATEQVGFVVGEKVLTAGIGEIVQEYTSWLSGQFHSAGWRIAGWVTSFGGSE